MLSYLSIYLLDVKCLELQECEIADPPVRNILATKNSRLFLACEFRSARDIGDSR